MDPYGGFGIEEFHHLERLCLSRVRGRFDDSEEARYRDLRTRLIQHPSLAAEIPEWLHASRSGDQLWRYLREFSSYREREDFIYAGLDGVGSHLEHPAQPVDLAVGLGSGVLAAKHVVQYWEKARARLTTDPEGSITAARAFLEAVCKQILVDRNVAPVSGESLPALYKRVAAELQLGPEQHAEQVFKQILAGCISVITGFAAVRNEFGDAHGAGTRPTPRRRHAELALNLAGSMALFLTSCANERPPSCKRSPRC